MTDQSHTLSLVYGPIFSFSFLFYSFNYLYSSPTLLNRLMAFYTAAAQFNLPRSPVAYAHHYLAMNATLPSIRPDALAWSWRSSSKLDPPSSTPLTPPMSTTFGSRNYTSGGRPSSSKIPSKMVADLDVREQPSSPMVLPPIAHLDRHIYNLPPCTYYCFSIPEVAPALALLFRSGFP